MATKNLSPGANLNTEYQKAAPGDLFKLAPGDYGAQKILKRVDGKQISPQIVFQGGKGVKVAGISIQGDGVHITGVSGKAFSFMGKSGTVPKATDPPAAWYVRDCTMEDSVFDGNGGGAFTAHRAENCALLQVELFSSVVVSGDSMFTSVIDILFDGCYIHDWVDVIPGKNHIEGLQFGGGDGVIVRNCIFENNDVHDFFMRSWGTTYDGDLQVVKRILIENNAFRKVKGYYALQILDDLVPAGTGPSDAIIRNNSWETTAALRLNETRKDPATKLQFYGNHYPGFSAYGAGLMKNMGYDVHDNVLKGGAIYFPGDTIDPNVDLHNAPGAPPVVTPPPIITPPPIVTPPPITPPADPCQAVKDELDAANVQLATMTSQVTALQAVVDEALVQAKETVDSLDG